jgi:AAHS family 4-hydroxybenzoate transporter-like MFS transporter
MDTRAGPGTTEIGQLIDERPLSRLQIRVMVLCGLLVLLDGYDIQTMALAVPSVVAEWSLPSGQFGFALAAALIGMMIGAALVAPFGDRWGRRPVLACSFALVGLASLATAFSTELWHLVAWRLLTGIGLGASLPNATALTSEYVPTQRRAALITLMYCNVALGALIAGFTAPPIIQAFGWRSIFVIGGVIPLVLSVLILLGIPESLKFLLARQRKDGRVAAIVNQLAPGTDVQSLYTAETTAVNKHSVAALFTPTYRPRTILLWCVFCLNLFALFMLISWLPTLLKDAGWSPANALRGSVMIQAGGIIAGLLLSRYVDRGKTVGAMVSAYILTAISLALFIVIPSTSASWWLLLLTMGAGTSGTQFALNALAAAFYPPVIRATGVGWGFGIGRIGAISGPLAGGLIVQYGLAPVHVIALLTIPVMICAGSVLLLPRVLRTQS